MKFDNDFKEIKIRHIIVIYLITCAILLLAAIFIFKNSGTDITDTNMNLLALLSGILLLTMLIYKIKPSKDKINLLYRDFRNKLNIKEIAWIIIFLVCLDYGGGKLLIDSVYIFSQSLANKFANDYSITINSTIDYWICFVILVILAPIIDELTFRYVLFKRLAKKFNVYTGLIVSSIVFSAINTCPDMIGTLSLGIISCILYVKYENILMPMFVYFISNLLLMLVAVPLGTLKHKIINYTSYDIKINAIIGMGLFFIGIILMIRFIIQNKVYLRENSIN